jgi:Flp pilus assembly protein TadD
LASVLKSGKIVICRSLLRFPIPVSRVITVLFFCGLARAETAADWTVAASTHFRVYSQAGEQPARSTLQWFEQLRTFFQRTGFALDSRPPVRIIGFRSQKDYEQYRLRPAADAYYVGTESSDCIVVPSLQANQAGVAAHEYAHLALHANGIELPAWLSEGLAEYFSTLQISERNTKLGGDLPMRSQTLQHSAWISLPQLLAATNDSRAAEKRADAGLFYAQSWALTEMLILSPAYKTRFPQFLSELSAKASSQADALTAVYGKPLDAITRDLHQWTNGGRIPAAVLPPILTDHAPVHLSKLTLRESRLLVAELLFDIGDLNRAEGAYRTVLRESPDSAEADGALGNIALRRGDREGARHYWELAIQHGIKDANLCYRYALLAEEMGLSQNEARTALERALALHPEFDDARYKLALMNNNNGNYTAALGQLLGMTHVKPARAYAYWSAIAYAYDQLGEREKTKVAATKAMQYAATRAERDRAAQLLYFAETDLTVQASRDANGNLQFVTTRVKHGSEHRNPFIEPEDQIVRIHGQLTRVDCANNTMTGVGVDTDKASLTLAIADPNHVLMRNAPQEFTCGPQSPVPVMVEYAAAKPGNSSHGLLRGMEFEKTGTDSR